MRADRLLSIVLLLQANRRMTAGELAQRLAVSERTILRDMNVLSGSGFPVVAQRGGAGGWSLMHNYRTTLTGLNAAEIGSLFAAVPQGVLADLGLQQSAENALLKLKASLPDESRDQADFMRRRLFIDSTGWRDRGDVIEPLPLVFAALWQQRRLRFDYRSSLAETTSTREVAPLGLVAKGSVWYLVAEHDGERKSFRVSRMANVQAALEAATVPDGFDLAQHWQQSTAQFREKLPRYHASFVVDGSTMRMVRYRGWRVEEETREGDRFVVRIRFDIEQEAVQFALSHGAGVRIIEPLDLREKVRSAAEGLVAHYRAEDPDVNAAGG